MSESIRLASISQPQSCLSDTQPLYLATSGRDLIESGLTLAWMVAILTDHVRLHREDVALWFLPDGEAPRIIAAFRPAPEGRTVVTWI